MSDFQPKAVLFDWDGTLVDTLPGLRLAHNHVRTAFGHPEWTDEEFKSNLKHSSRELYPKLYGDRWQEAFDTLYAFVEANHLQHISLFEKADKLLDCLAAQDVLLAVVSNKRHQYLVREVAHMGWTDRFFCTIGAGQAARDKPSADPVHMALGLCETGLKPDDVLFVGDTETDLLAAEAAGCRAALITHGKDLSALIEKFRPYIVANDCGDLLSVLCK